MGAPRLRARACAVADADFVASSAVAKRSLVDQVRSASAPSVVTTVVAANDGSAPELSRGVCGAAGALAFTAF